MERQRRLVLLVMMSFAAIVFVLKGRGPSLSEGTAAFFHEEQACLTVRISGNIAKPGVYTFPCNTDVSTAIKLTAPDFSLERNDHTLLSRVLQNGDVLDIDSESNQPIDITLEKMQAREMVVLGIRLDPNSLGIDDWESLPGIGPSLACEIVRDRQNNGDFGSYKDLQRVPGIGENKMRDLAKYF